jgi:hypothetical protein
MMVYHVIFSILFITFGIKGDNSWFGYTLKQRILKISRYIGNISPENGKYQAESREFWIFLLSLKRESRGLRTKGLLTITFAHNRARGRGFL